MFAVLLNLVDQGVIDKTNKYLHKMLHPGSSVDDYHQIMHNNGLDGHRFVKPERGHELDATPFTNPTSAFWSEDKKAPVARLLLS